MLIADNVSQTLENCTAVLHFLSEFNSRVRSELADDYGQVLVIDWVAYALEKQYGAMRAHDQEAHDA